jgi:HD-like signal output (HDOD) protein
LVGRNRLVDKKLHDFQSRLLDGEKKHNIPCISRTLQKLLAIDAESELSAQELAEIILEDYGLISKVLQTVNTFYYNSLGHEITTVTQAVILLGFNAVRRIAVSLSIIDLLPDSGNSVAARVMALAFVSAHLASSLGGEREGNPEEIFISALFKPLARLYVAIYDPDFYSFLEETEQSSDDKEEIEQIKKFWHKLGVEIARSWHLPLSTTVRLHSDTLGVRFWRPITMCPIMSLARALSSTMGVILL